MGRDLRMALRTIRRYPGFSVAVVLTLAVAIGPNTSIFSLVNSILLRPLPFADAEELVWVSGSRERTGTSGFTASSYEEYLRWRDLDGIFEEIGAYYDRSFNLSGDGTPERVSGAVASPTLFSALGVRPVLGRSFLEEETVAGRDRVTILGNGLWRRRFGADPEIVGSTVLLHGEEHRVVGVMPRGFKFPQYADIWIPLSTEPEEKGRHEPFLWAVGRLEEGRTAAEARSAVAAATARLGEVHPEQYAEATVEVLPLRRFFVGDTGTAALLFIAVTGLVLLVACANIAGLFLARAAQRQREIAVQIALGARRRGLARQLLTESVVLALFGGATGLALGAAGLRLLESSIPVELPFWASFDLDAAVVLFVFGVSLAAGCLCALAPMLQLARPELTPALQVEGGRGGSGGSSSKMRNALVLSEIAISLILLTGAAVAGRSLLYLQQGELGFDADGIMTFYVNLPNKGYEEPVRRSAFYQQSARRIKALPGVLEVGTASALPLQSWYATEFVLPDGDGPADEPLSGLSRAVGGDFFEVLGMRFVRGRPFGELDVALESSNVAIVNRAFAERHWSLDEAVGMRLRLTESRRTVEIVGVVEDIRQSGLERAVRPEIYLPLEHDPLFARYFLVRSSGDPYEVVAPAREAIESIAPTIPIYQVQSLREVVDAAFWQPRLYSWLLGIFAGIALFLAAVGIYGVISFLVERRRREIGVRMALGAHPGQVVGLMLRQVVELVVAGLIVGLIGSIAFARLLGSALYGIGSGDAVTFATVGLVLVCVAGLAAFVPAHRAARGDPMIALQEG